MYITFPMALALLFIGLKLTSTIDWSWVWVLSPIWLTIIWAFVVAFIQALNEAMKK